MGCLLLIPGLVGLGWGTCCCPTPKLSGRTQPAKGSLPPTFSAFLFYKREGCSMLIGVRWLSLTVGGTASEAARPRPPWDLGHQWPGASSPHSWAGTRTHGGFSGLLLISAPAQPQTRSCPCPPPPPSPLPSPLLPSPRVWLRTVSPLEAQPHQTLQRLSHRGVGAPRELLTVPKGSLQRPSVTGGCPPSERSYRFGGDFPQEGPSHQRVDGRPL